jgi:hypothetical protein
MAKNAKNRAYVKGREFSITTEDVIRLWESQEGKCCLTDVDFQLTQEPRKPHKDGPSLDRIDSTKGYTPSNIRLVTYQVNTALSSFGEDELVKMAVALINNRSTNNDFN